MSGHVKNAPRRNPASSDSKLTEAERHKRFIDMAREVGASDDPKDFNEAFDKVIHPSDQSEGHSERRVRGAVLTKPHQKK